MNLFSKNRNNEILKQEAFILDETRKDNKIVEKKWKSNHVLGIITVIIIVSMFLSLIF